MRLAKAQLPILAAVALLPTRRRAVAIVMNLSTRDVAGVVFIATVK